MFWDKLSIWLPRCTISTNATHMSGRKWSLIKETLRARSTPMFSALKVFYIHMCMFLNAAKDYIVLKELMFFALLTLFVLSKIFNWNLVQWSVEKSKRLL